MSKLLVRSCCLLRNLGEWPLMWASPDTALLRDCPFSFLCWYTHFILALTLTCRFLEGEDGEDTAKILQADIVEAVDIASAAKVSLRLGNGPLHWCRD